MMRRLLAQLIATGCLACGLFVTGVIVQGQKPEAPTIAKVAPAADETEIVKQIEKLRGKFTLDEAGRVTTVVFEEHSKLNSYSF